MSEPAVPMQIAPVHGARPEVARCTACDYTAGPFVNAKAADDAYLAHVRQRHPKMLASCECGWLAGPFPQKWATIRAVVAHAAEAHKITARLAPLNPFTEEFSRKALVACMARLQHSLKQEEQIVTAGQPPRDPAKDLVRIGNDLLMGVSAAIDLLLEARTGNPQIRQKTDEDEA